MISEQFRFCGVHVSFEVNQRYDFAQDIVKDEGASYFQLSAQLLFSRRDNVGSGRRQEHSSAEDRKITQVDNPYMSVGQPNMGTMHRAGIR